MDVRNAFRSLRMTPGHTSVTTRSVAEAPQDTTGQHRDVSGHLKDTRGGYTDLADTHGWGLRNFIFLVDVSLLIRDICDNIKDVPVGASDHWIPGS